MTLLPNPSRFFLNYLLGLLTFSVTTGILYLLRELLDTPLIALLFLLPVGLNTAFWGLGPGILTALSAFLGFNYFFIPPYYTLVVHQTSDLAVLIVFLIVAVVISQLVARAQAGMSAATARESEATKLYELSTALAGLQDEQSISHIVAEQTLQTFQAEQVELIAESAIRNIRLCLPEGSTTSSRKPELVAPLETVRGALGEIRVWRSKPLNQPAEERLLRTFASQGAMALERAWLAQTETRAKVLEESDRLKSALLSSVSHELRSPLATIKASITSLRSGEVQWKSPAREDLLAAVDDETDHLNRLVGNLLDMSRIESGALKPQRQWNLIGEIVGGVIARIRRVPEQHKLVVDVPEDLPLVPVDYVQMEQVFDNLISNSLKYAPPKTTIHVSARKQNERTLLVNVSNQGPPVPKEHLDRIFDKFYRVTDADRVTGTGLGLSICKGIITAHGGNIWAENLPDGFAFNFTLPLTLDGTPPPRLPVDPETI
jgi:two-component system, OmpR family, sensor histidine kinase KdpD